MRLALVLFLAGQAWGQMLAPIVADTHHSGGGGGVTLVAHNIGHAVDNAVTGAMDTTGANFGVCALSAYTSGPADSIQDSKSNTWTPLTTASNSAVFDRVTLYYTVAPTVGTGHTVTNNTTGSYTTIACAFFSGVKTSSTFESESTADSQLYSGVTGIQPGAVTPATTGDLVIGSIGWGFNDPTVTFTVDSGFTITDQFTGNTVTEGGALAYLIAPSTSSVNPAWTPSAIGSGGLGIAVFAKQ